ncbi:hypothetical protein CYLTODRAFT_362653, partial [Cylindrobasidium torrendii FP15055 ss-10]
MKALFDAQLDLDRAKDEGEKDASKEEGPKTSYVPDPSNFPSSKMRETLDMGQIPEELKERAWEVLEKHKDAFGFDGKLGNVATAARIRTMPDTEPINLPMYGTSPEKRRVIEEQVNKWFSQDVIEASKSPWSAPVVIVYRNGKPRF